MKPTFSSFHFTFISAFIQEWGYSFDSKYQRCRAKCLTLPLPKVHLTLELHILSHQPELKTVLLFLWLGLSLAIFLITVSSKLLPLHMFVGFNKSTKKKFRKAPFRENVPITSSGDLTFSKYTRVQLQCVCCVNLVWLCWSQQMWSRFAALSWN